MEHMAHAPFILASYAIAAAVFLTLGVTSWRRAKALEAAAERLRAAGGGRRGRVPG